MKWVQIGSNGGLFSILAAVTKAGGVKNEVTYWHEKQALLDSLVAEQHNQVFGRRVRDYGDCAVLNDDSVLACLTFADFAGSFASHEDINVEWWIGR